MTASSLPWSKAVAKTLQPTHSPPFSISHIYESVLQKIIMKKVSVYNAADFPVFIYILNPTSVIYAVQIFGIFCTLRYSTVRYEKYESTVFSASIVSIYFNTIHTIEIYPMRVRSINLMFKKCEYAIKNKIHFDCIVYGVPVVTCSLLQ